MTGIINNLIPHYSGWLQILTRRLVMTNFFPMNGITEVVDLSRHDWKYLVSGGAQKEGKYLGWDLLLRLANGLR